MRIHILIFFLSFISEYSWAQTITIGETDILSIDDTGNGNLLCAQNVTLPQEAIIQSLSFYVTNAAGKLRMGIYDASGPGGGPGLKQAETNSISPVTGWNTANVIVPVPLSPGTYWIAYLPSENELAFKKGITDGTSLAYYPYSFGTLPATFSTNPSTDPYHWSFYATLSTAPDTIAPVISGVLVSSITQSSANVNWTTDESADSQVEYGLTAAYGSSTNLVPDLITLHTISLSGLMPLTEYHFRVISVDYFNNTTTSEDFTFTTTAPDLIPPSPPTDLVVTSVSSSQINLSWIPSIDDVGVIAYEVERCTGIGCSDFSMPGISSGNTYSDHGLSYNTTYRYRVRAVDAGENYSEYSDIVESTTLNPPLIKVSPTGRYLANQYDVPFMMVGDSPQSLIVNLSPEEVEYYIADRQAHGFNSMWINLLCNTGTAGRPDGTTYDGIQPFTIQGDISTPNEDYFARVDQYIHLAADHNIVVVLDPIETIGWLGTLHSNGLEKAYDYGVYLGLRYKDFPNIIWMSGNDFQSWSNQVDDSLVQAVALGIRSVDQNHIHTAELNYLTSSTLNDTTWSSVISLNAAYTYYPTYAEVLHAYNQSSNIPVFMVEAHYELENVGGEMGTPLVLRRQEYWTMLSGATGQLYGNAYTWQFLNDWKNNIDTRGVTELQIMQNLFLALPWYNLIPDQNQTIITDGFGTFTNSGNVSESDYATAARTPDGKLVIAYLPTIHTVTIDLTNLSGPVTASWFDPTSATYTGIAESPFPNTGTNQFTSPGQNSAGEDDWVLILTATDATTSIANFDNANDPFIKVFPNPATSSFVVEVKSPVSDGQLAIYNLLGKVMLTRKLNGNSYEIESGSLDNGVYIVSVNINGRQYVQKIVIE